MIFVGLNLVQIPSFYLLPANTVCVCHALSSCGESSKKRNINLVVFVFFWGVAGYISINCYMLPNRSQPNAIHKLHDTLEDEGAAALAKMLRNLVESSSCVKCR